MFKKMLRNGAGRVVLFTLALLAPCVQNPASGQAPNMDGELGEGVVSPPHNRFSPPMTSHVDAAQNKIADATHDNDPIEETITSSRANTADSWGPVPTKKASVANSAP